MTNKKQAITAQEVSEAYGIPRGSLANLRFAKKGPRFYKVGRKILYKVSDLENWIYANPVQTIDGHYNDR